MIGVDDDADALAERVAEVERLAERVEDRAVGGVDRVERLDGEGDAEGTRLRQDRREPVGDHRAGAGDVARAGRQAADDEDEAVGAERRRLVDGAAVVVDRGTAAGSIGGGEHAAAAEAGDAQAVAGEDAGRLGKADLRHLVAPGCHRRDAVADAGRSRLAQVPLLAHRGEVDRETLGAHRPRLPSPQAMPPSASTALMRLAASSGSRSTRAWSARRKSSARWRSERALCWPPSMTK